MEDTEEIVAPFEEREYQEFGTFFLKTIRRGWLTDDPGLGKTRQAINAAELPAMVVAPYYLGGQWADAIRRVHGDAKIAHANGTRKERDRILDRKADWYIVNPEMVKSYDMPTEIRTYINDEAHHLSHRQADKTKAVNLMENRDPNARIYHLTATPFWKNIDDIWMQGHILYPKIFNSYHQFVKLYCRTIRTPWGGPKVLGVKTAMRRGLNELLKPIMLGRTYKDVGRFLPDTVETIIRLDMDPVLRAVYNQVLNNYYLMWEDEEEKRRLIFNPATALHPLRQITAKAGKFDAINQIIVDNNQPAVIGFLYRDHATEMYKMLGEKNAVLVTGEQSGQERQKLALWAQANKKHIVASQKSLSEGVNLPEYRLFIWGETDHVPGRNHQFLSRVVRDRNDGGRDTSPVRVYYVEVRNTVDGIIRRVSKSRKTAIDATRELLDAVMRKR